MDENDVRGPKKYDIPKTRNMRISAINEILYLEKTNLIESLTKYSPIRFNKSPYIGIKGNKERITPPTTPPYINK